MHADKKALGVSDDGGEVLGQLGSEGGPGGGAKNQCGKGQADPPDGGWGCPPAPVGQCK